MNNNSSDKHSNVDPTGLQKANKYTYEDYNPDIKDQSFIDRFEKNNLTRHARQIVEQLADDNHSPAIIRGSFRLFESVEFFIAGLISYFILADGTILNCLNIVVPATFFFTMAFFSARLYSTRNLSSGFRGSTFGIVILSTLFIVMVVFVYSVDFDPPFLWNWFYWWFVFSVIAIIITRLCFAVFFSRWNRNGFMERRAVIVGGADAAKTLIRDIEDNPDNDIRICGIFDDRNNDRSPPMVAGYPKLGLVTDVVAFARTTPIDMIILTIPLAAEGRWSDILKHLWVLPVDIRLAVHANSAKFRPRFYSHTYNSKVPMLALLDKPITDWNLVRKRVFDLSFTIMSLALLWPIMIATAIAVKLTSKGPVFFRQKRHGINNEQILIYKFRSMYNEMSDENVIKAVTKNDARVTKVGRFIRKTSIDELPQLFNVLRGDLSLIGPRPHAVAAKAQNKYFADMVEGYFARHRVKPGITGWAQINGLRGEITSDDKIRQRTEYDLYYIENWSLWFDLKILLTTPIILFNTENAY